MDGKFIALLLTVSVTAFGGTWWYINRPPPVLEQDHIKAAPPIVTAKGEKLSFKDCSEVNAKGYAPLLAGSPGYTPELDHDGDGIACPPTS